MIRTHEFKPYCDAPDYCVAELPRSGNTCNRPKEDHMRDLHVIVREIEADWTKPYFGAVPYIKAMHALNGINDTYGFDSAREIVMYFLSNATTWRGPVARVVKAELKAMLKA